MRLTTAHQIGGGSPIFDEMPLNALSLSHITLYMLCIV
jgi:hypothetical protein